MSDSFTESEVAFMRRALALARRGEGRVEPNPMVGCVLVRGGRIIGEGWHRRFGGPHAEIWALRQAGKLARGATAYVTLEPCCYTGKTPPCTEALIAAGVKRVVASVTDPNPRVAGNGLRALRRAGTAANSGLLAGEGTRLVAPFRKWITTGMPWVILKWAQSLDGKIATRTGDSKWISDETARRHAHRTRGRVDAIIVGVGTVLSDDPALTCRLAARRRVAARVVLDSLLRTPPDAQIVRTAKETPTIAFCAADAPPIRRAALEKAGCSVRAIATGAPRRDPGAGSSGRARRPAAGSRATSRTVPLHTVLRDTVSPHAVLRELGRMGMSRVMVEGGARVLGSFFDAGLFDEIHAYVAPRLFGGRLAPGPLGGVGPAGVRDAVGLSDATCRRLGTGWLVTGTKPLAK